MKGSFRLGRVAGIEIGVHYTWLFAFVLIAWTLAEGFFPTNFKGWERATYWVIGILSSLLLFSSVLVHELAHSFMARRLGMRVLGITLFIFGGVSNMQGEARKARDEFLVAIVGPLTSFVLAGVFWLVLLLVEDRESPAAAVLWYLAFINALLGGFNLIPGFPLDGGRVLRSILWGVTKNLAKATNVAARVGQGFGFALIGWGVFQILTGNFIGGLWTAFIGWFLNGAAEASRREVGLQQAFKGVMVKEVMDSNPETTGPATLVSDLVSECFLRRGRRAVPVCEDGRVLGIVTLTDVKGLDQKLWPYTRVDQIMTREPLHSVSPEDDLAKVLQTLAGGDLNQVLVIREGSLVGMLSRADIIRHLQSRQELGLDFGRSNKSR